LGKENNREQNYEFELKIAKEAVIEAGKIVMEGFRQKAQRWQKAPGDFVSQIDLEAEKKIADVIETQWPEDGIMSEEDINFGLDRERFWIIDPLDGTMNFLREVPYFSLSLALFARGEVVVGVVYDPFQKELFSAGKNKGAFLNSREIKIGEVDNLQESCITTEYVGYLDSSKKTKILQRLGENFANIRMPGSQALGLAYTAMGRFDLSYLPRSNAWDMAAGSLIIKEAGGKVWASGPGGYSCLDSGEITAGNPKLVDKFIEDVLKENL